MREGPKESERVPTLEEPYEHLVLLQGDTNGPDTPTASHARARLNTLLNLQLTNAISSFSAATTKLNVRLIWLTVVLVVLTAVLVWIGFVQIHNLR